MELIRLTLVLALLDSIILDPTTVVGVLHAWLNLAVSEGTCETSKQFLGFLVGLGLACWTEGFSERSSGFVTKSKRTVGVAVLLVLAGSEVGGTSGGEFVGQLWLVVTTLGDLIVGLSLVRVYESNVSPLDHFSLRFTCR